ncbi:hypothetical protein [Pandoraea bronchicola]|uniref:Outer membrane protein B n=1 Tax=Pandoraea bronchicola TaxID=2508287 RepID=A0A5E5BQV8_9BURK|nr:hypothetical protein [Pandoraea bronchicola]VVE87657.1 Outer membrane protein B [Pandoraea bronchicola]
MRITNAAGTSAPIAVTVTVQAVPVTASGRQVNVSANESTNHKPGFVKDTRIGTLSPYIRVELQHDVNGQRVAGLAYADIAGSGPVYFVPGSP